MLEKLVIIGGSLTIVFLTAFLVVLVVLSVRHRDEERAACERNGRHYVVDHYVTVFIPITNGKTTTIIPTQSAVYKCVE